MVKKTFAGLKIGIIGQIIMLIASTFTIFLLLAAYSALNNDMDLLSWIITILLTLCGYTVILGLGFVVSSLLMLISIFIMFSDSKTFKDRMIAIISLFFISISLIIGVIGFYSIIDFPIFGFDNSDADFVLIPITVSIALFLFNLGSNLPVIFKGGKITSSVQLISNLLFLTWPIIAFVVYTMVDSQRSDWLAHVSYWSSFWALYLLPFCLILWSILNIISYVRTFKWIREYIGEEGKNCYDVDLYQHESKTVKKKVRDDYKRLLMNGKAE